MKRLVIASAAAALIVTGCSSADEPAATDPAPTEPPASDPAPAETDPAPAETDPPPADTEAPPDTEPPPSGPALAVTEVVFGGAVTVTNVSSETVSTAGFWLCNRPSYTEIAAVDLAPGESIEVSDLPTAANGGEVALYTSQSFGDPSAIIDYVAWGFGGGRLAVAVDAGLWPEADAVEDVGASIAAANGGASSADWTSN